MNPSLWQKSKSFILSHKYVLWVLYLPCYLILFYLVEHVVVDDYWVSYLPLDDLIPFNEWFVIPYCMWYPAMAYAGILLLVTQPDAFRRYMLFMSIGFTFCIVFCLIFPNGQDLRPAVMPRDNILCRLVFRLYSADTNTNVLPSMHVVGAAMVMFGLFESKYYQRWWKKLLVFAICFLITISTVFIKQHSILDIFASVILCVLLWLGIYFIPAKVRKRRSRAAIRE